MAFRAIAPRLTVRGRVSHAAAVLTASLLAGCGTDGSPAASSATQAASQQSATGAANTVKISYPQPAPAFVILRIAQDRGLFKQYGLNSQVVHIAPPADVQAAVSGDLQFDVDGSLPVSATASGGDLIFVAVPLGYYTQLFYAAPGIANVQQLAGKTVAATARGTPSDFSLQTLLKQAGLQSSQLSITYLHDDAAILAALQSGTIQGGILTTTSAFRAKQQGLKFLVDMADLKLPTVNSGVAVKRDWARQHPNLVEGFLKALLEGVKFVRDDPATTKSALRTFIQNEDPAQLDEAYEQSVLRWSPYPLVTDAMIQGIIDISAEAAVKNHKPAEFYDNSYLLKLQDFAKGLYPNGIPS